MSVLRRGDEHRSVEVVLEETRPLLDLIVRVVESAGAVYRGFSVPEGLEPTDPVSKLQSWELVFEVELPWRGDSKLRFTIPWPFWYDQQGDLGAFWIGRKVWKWYPKILNIDLEVLSLSAGYERYLKRYLNWTRKSPKNNPNFSAMILQECRLLDLNASTMERSERKLRWAYERDQYREVHPNYYGRVDPVATTEGLKVGLTLAMAKDAKVIEGKLHAPTDQGWISSYDQGLNFQYGYLDRDGSLGTGRLEGAPTLQGSLVSLTLETVPFLEYNDLNRLTMAYSQIRSAVDDLVHGPDLPSVRTRTQQELGLYYGKELRVAYTNLEGLTYEDAVVISESAAEALRIYWRDEIRLISDRYRKVELRPEIAPGYQLEPEEVIGQYHRRIVTNPLGDLVSERRSYTSYPIKAQLPLKGIIEEVYQHEKELSILVRMEVPVMVGDKITGRYGNKGIVAQILPDSEMPQTEEGPIQVVISPASVIGRMNLGQLYEVYLSQILDQLRSREQVEAFKTYLPFLHWSEVEGRAIAVYENFSRSLDPWKLQEALRALGLPEDGLRPVYLPKYNYRTRVLWGRAYFLRSHHLAVYKSHGVDVAKRSADYPLRGRSSGGGQRIGEMEVRGILSHQARGVLSELPYRCDGDLISYRYQLFKNGAGFSLKSLRRRHRSSFEYVKDVLRSLWIDLEVEDEVQG